MPSVLFLCLGNICRSPAAEGVFKHLVQRSNVSCEVDSCGTGGGSPNWFKPFGFSFHEGDLADHRMSEAAARRGILLESRARPLRRDDVRFDIIVCMDSSNIQSVKEAANAWELPELVDKCVLMTSYFADGGGEGDAPTEVPDPYFVGGFDAVLDLLEVCCKGLLKDVMSR